MWREIRRGRQVIPEAVLSRGEEILTSSVDVKWKEEGGSKSDILEEMLKDFF